MVEWGSRPLLTKIVLGIAVFFSVIMLVCFCVGGPLYIQERSKTQSYVKDSCHVTSTSYETIDKCIDETVRTIRHRTCYIALWDVQLGGNSARKETIRSGPENSYQHMEAKQEQYKIGSSYPCWYNINHPFQLSWYAPNVSYALILLIIGGISIPFAIISFIGFARLRTPADL